MLWGLEVAIWCLRIGHDEIFGDIWLMLKPADYDVNIFEHIGLLAGPQQNFGEGGGRCILTII